MPRFHRFVDVTMHSDEADTVIENSPKCDIFPNKTLENQGFFFYYHGNCTQRLFVLNDVII